MTKDEALKLARDALGGAEGCGMKSRPILFSAPMVRALLDGSKTQTRRKVKMKSHHQIEQRDDDSLWPWMYDSERNTDWWMPCPYGQPGDREWRVGLPPQAGMYYVRGLLDESVGGDSRAVWVSPEHFTWGFSESDDPEAIDLDTEITPENIHWKRPGDQLWVREAFYEEFGCAPTDDEEREHWIDNGYLAYRASDDQPYGSGGYLPWRPSIHMPRWASRITLEVVGVRVERLQEISEVDAEAEGVQRTVTDDGWRRYCNDPDQEAAGLTPCRTARASYQSLWDSINQQIRPTLPHNTASKRYERVKRWLDTHPDTTSWDANPWVWVIEFRSLTK